MLTIDKSLSGQKKELLEYFRERGNESLKTLETIYGVREFREKAHDVNTFVGETKENLVKAVLQRAEKGKWSNEEKLSCVLLITYTSNIVMLELRNDVWPYEYMTFSRRIGEIWEPFCELCFDYPIKELEIFVPPLFSEVKNKLRVEINDYIKTLPISREHKEALEKYYNKVWVMVPERVDLELDLHFIQNSEKFVVDFKSGFGSNEKGNANRLLLVASIYKNLEENYRCLLFVRAAEEENNNYFQLLKKSGLWEAYCGHDTYNQIYIYTGFDLEAWIKKNIDWMNDFKPEMIEHISKNNLGQYLIW